MRTINYNNTFRNRRGHHGLVALAAGIVVLAVSLATAQQIQPGADVQDAPPAMASSPLTADQLQQLLAPIALYPDSLVAQILAASTYPTQIVEADRWLQQNPNLADDQLAQAVDQQSWDPSVKALTPFASVLSNLDTNLSWTSALGDAYYNQPQDVMDAIQELRIRAQAAGNLQSNQQEAIVQQGSSVAIEPADPDVVYVPSYDPWLCYGAPIGIYPGYIYSPWISGPFISFGFGHRIRGGYWNRYRWGWNSWAFNWGRRAVYFDRNPYISHSPNFFNRFPGRGAGGFGRGNQPFPGNGGPRGNGPGGNGGFPGPRGGGNLSFPGSNGGALGPRGGGNQTLPGGNGSFPRGGGGQTLPGGNGGFPRGGGTFPGGPGRNPGSVIVPSTPSPNFGRDRGPVAPLGGGNSGGLGQRGNRGFGQSNPGIGSGPFGGFGPGGVVMGSSSRGRGSFGGFGVGSATGNGIGRGTGNGIGRGTGNGIGGGFGRGGFGGGGGVRIGGGGGGGRGGRH